VSHNSLRCLRVLADAQPPDWTGDWGHLFCADHKLSSKTSITCWANAISIQQPYHLHKQWVLPKGSDHCLILCVNNEALIKRGRREDRGRSNVVMQRVCYQERKVKCALSTWNRMLSHTILVSFAPSLSDEHSTVMNYLFTLPMSRGKVFFLSHKHNKLIKSLEISWFSCVRKDCLLFVSTFGWIIHVL